jgi:4-amino-4-deoxy-L-arabinose transferase-like glycosyltransferase
MDLKRTAARHLDAASARTERGLQPLALLLSPLLALYLLTAAVGPAFVHHSDEPTYMFFANQLLHGRYAAEHSAVDAHYLWVGPGLPLVMAPFVAAGVSLALMRALGALFLFGAVLAFHRLLRLFVSPRAALAGAVSLGLYIPYLVVTMRLLSEPLSLFAGLVGLVFAVRFVRGGTAWDLGGAGFSLGWLALTRVVYGYVLAAMVVITLGWWVWRRRDDLRRWALVFAAALAMCVPWLVYTYSVTHEVFYWGNSGAMSLYWMASPSPGNHGDWRAPDDPMAASDRAVLQRLRGRDPLEREQALRRAALRNVRRHPTTYAAHVGSNISRMVVDAPYSYGAGEGMRVLIYALPNLALLGLLAWALLRRRAGPLPRELVVLSVLAAVIFGLHALLAAYPRMLTLVVPLAILVLAQRVEARAPATARV